MPLGAFTMSTSTESDFLTSITGMVVAANEDVVRIMNALGAIQAKLNNAPAGTADPALQPARDELFRRTQAMSAEAKAIANAAEGMSK